MQRALELIEQFTDVVEVEPGPDGPEVTGANLEGRASVRGRRAGQASTEYLVDDLLERLAGPARPRFQLRRHVVIERQGRAHILMLKKAHHDGQSLPPRQPFTVQPSPCRNSRTRSRSSPCSSMPSSVGAPPVPQARLSFWLRSFRNASLRGRS